MLEKNKCYISEITGITAEGNGICRIENMVVFVPNTAVGDKLSVKIVKVLKKYSFGIIDKIIIPSEDRIESDCAVSKKCGGCIFRHISYEAECRIKQDIVVNSLKRIGGLNPQFDEFVSCDNISHYRNKAQYPVALINGKAQCGFYAPRSHNLIPVTNCDLQPVIFKKITEYIMEYINKESISVYSEITGEGDIRHLYLRQGQYSKEIMVCIVARRNIADKLFKLKSISSQLKNIVSIVLNINPDNTNVILGKECITIYGSDTITDTMCGNTIQISPLSFYQVNTLQAEKLYEKALSYADPDENSVLVDLYCGTGTIGLSMARKVKKVIGIEIINEAIDNAKINARNNNIFNAEFFCGDAGKILTQLIHSGCKPDILVIDPPRKGCSIDTLKTIIDASPEKIVMISCNPATAARDLKWLSENGYSVSKACGVDMFPRTGHVECVVLMSRNDS